MTSLNCIVMQDRRSRLKDSEVSASQLREALKEWFKTVGSRLIDANLTTVSAEWPHRGMPIPSQLVQLQPLSLVEGILKIDATLHPRHARLVTAILAEHGAGPCFSGTRGIELESMLVSRLILAVLRKYRDLAKYADKWVALCKKCTPDEREILGRIVGSISIAEPVGRRTEMSTEIVPYSGSSMAVMALDGGSDGFDELDDFNLEPGLFFGLVAIWGYFFVAPPCLRLEIKLENENRISTSNTKIEHQHRKSK